MADWVTLNPVATNQIIRVDLFQDIWTDLYNLKQPIYTEKLCTPQSGGYVTSSATFSILDTTNFRLYFQSFGGDVLVGLLIRQRNSNAQGGGKFGFVLDGVSQGNSSGQANFQNISAITDGVNQLTAILHDLAAGQHYLDLQFAVGPSNAGTETAYFNNGASQFTFWAVEFP